MPHHLAVDILQGSIAVLAGVASCVGWRVSRRHVPKPELPFDARAAAAIDRAEGIAKEMGYAQVETEHVLLAPGVLADQRSLAWGMLFERRVTRQLVEEKLERQRTAVA